MAEGRGNPYICEPVYNLQPAPSFMKDYKKYYHIPASPEEVYLALTSPTAIQLWSGEVAEMSTEPGSLFSLWENSITGRNLEFIENQKIVQEWDFEGEPEASIVTIKLFADKLGTSLELRHTNIPDEAYDEIVEGWNANYMMSLSEFFDGI